MRFEEYQQRKRALEEQLRTDLELIQAGYRAKTQALEMLWMASGSASQVETQTRGETQQPAETQEPRLKTTILITSVQDEVEAILPSLPDVFDKDDVIRTLGWAPNRATLHRALDHLRVRKRIAVETPGQGRQPTRFRRMGGG